MCFTLTKLGLVCKDHYTWFSFSKWAIITLKKQHSLTVPFISLFPFLSFVSLTCTLFYSIWFYSVLFLFVVFMYNCSLHGFWTGQLLNYDHTYQWYMQTVRRASCLSWILNASEKNKQKTGHMIKEKWIPLYHWGGLVHANVLLDECGKLIWLMDLWLLVFLTSLSNLFDAFLCFVFKDVGIQRTPLASQTSLFWLRAVSHFACLFPAFTKLERTVLYNAGVAQCEDISHCVRFLAFIDIL